MGAGYFRPVNVRLGETAERFCEVPSFALPVKGSPATDNAAGQRTTSNAVISFT